MGIKRIIDTDLWTDEKVETFTPEEKYFWLFLLTNPHTKQLGIYHITKKQMSFYLGYDIETVSKLIDRFQNNYKLIRFINGEIAIKNYLKHSVIKGGKPVEDCINRDMKDIKNKGLISWVFKSIEGEDLNATVQRIITEYHKEESTKEESFNDNDNDNDNERYVDDTSTYRGDVVDCSPEFTRALKDFEAMRKASKKPLTPRAKQMILKELSKLATDEKTQIEILDQSTMNSWLGVYPLKKKESGLSIEDMLNMDIPEYSSDDNPYFDQGRFDELMERRKS